MKDALPQYARKHQSQRPLKSGKKLSKLQQDMIAVFVFAVGFSMLISLGWLTYRNFISHSGYDEKDGISKIQSAISSEENKKTALRSASMQNMQGIWVASTTTQKLFLVVSKGRFQISLWLNETGTQRNMSAGTIRYYDEFKMMTLVPNNSYKPKNLKNVKIGRLTSRSFNIVPLYDEEKGLLYLAPYENSEDNKVSRHPIFTYLRGRDKYIRFQPYKASGS